MIAKIILLIVLIILNAFFAASEIALISLNDNKIRLMAEEGNKKSILIRQILLEPSKFLATIQIGITLAGFLASAFAADSFSGPLVGWLLDIGVPVAEHILNTIAVIAITIVLAYFTLVLGELVPKRIAMKKAEEISSFAVIPLNFISRVTSPFVRFLTASTNFFVRLAGIDPKEEEEKVTEEEIRMMVDVGEESGTIHVSEKEMINNIFEFDNKTAYDIMTPRIDIVGIQVDSSIKSILVVMGDRKYTRFPVYKKNIDNIIGILHVKDLLPYLEKDRIADFNLKNIIRKPYFVPESKKTDDLFQELQKKKIHMAVIIDEYGGTAGIVTIEDLIEEIVGNIFDEYDEFEKEFESLDNNTFIINGFVTLDAVSQFLKVELPIEDYGTLSGFVIGELGRIPSDGEQPVIEYNGLVFKVDSIKDKCVRKVKVYKS